jgi:hypothetical protein
VKTIETVRDEIRVGASIDSWCGKCKMMLAHTIEAMVGPKPARVSCNTCRSQHNYKASPPGEASTKVSRLPRAAGSPRKTANRYQALLKAGEAAGTKSYLPTQKYETGDVLEHPTFGRGVATAVKEGAKIEVLFEGGSKTLVHGR